MNNKEYAETQKILELVERLTDTFIADDDPQTGLIGQLEFIGVQLERIARALEGKGCKK